MSDDTSIKKKDNNKILLTNTKNNIIEEFPLEESITKIYYQEAKIPSQSDLDKLKKKSKYNDVVKIKKAISSQDKLIPLFDIFTRNIYLIRRKNVYHRVVNNNYRFPDSMVIKEIQNDYQERLDKINKDRDLKKDKVYMRYIKKVKLMLDFLDQFDMQILYGTYLDVFYRYSPDIGNATFSCRRKSFIPHLGHINPYYSRDEVVKFAMNLGEDVPEEITEISKDKFNSLCKFISENDVNSKTLLSHQKHIIDKNSVGLIQYYTIQGSFFMNQYMRKLTRYTYQNLYLENNIRSMWDLVLDSPTFDKDYTLYRFINSDSYLSNLKIGDIYQEPGFTSTTRDPFYRNDLYQFGFILLKIKIPKGVKGVGLCLETLSHFPGEQEIILAPKCKLKLVKKDSDIIYHHPDEEFVSSITRRYEFEWIENGKTDFPRREEYNKETPLVDFLKLDSANTYSINEKINIFVNDNLDPMNRFRCKIGDKEFYVIAEWYDSTGAYEEMYALKTRDGFCFYTIYEGYILFMIEIGEQDGHRQIRVNYYVKYSQLKRDDILGDDNFIKFISSIAYYFDIPNVIIYADYISCDKKLSSESKMERGKYLKKKKVKITQAGGGIQRGFQDSNKATHTNYKDLISNTSNDMSEESKSKMLVTTPEGYLGGSFCVDFYRFLKHNTRRYQNTETLNVELQPGFSYHDLLLMKDTSPKTILKKTDSDEIYQIYVKTYISDHPSKDNLSDFYIWMINHRCYLMDIFIKKFDRLFKKDNPFKRDWYRLDAMTYLYNRNMISTFSRHIKMNFDEDHELLKLPKNEYRN